MTRIVFKNHTIPEAAISTELLELSHTAGKVATWYPHWEESFGILLQNET